MAARQEVSWYAIEINYPGILRPVYRGTGEVKFLDSGGAIINGHHMTRWDREYYDNLEEAEKRRNQLLKVMRSDVIKAIDRLNRQKEEFDVLLERLNNGG